MDLGFLAKLLPMLFTGLKVIKDKSLLPFAMDPFGNYYCLKGNEVGFLDLETETFMNSHMSLEEFTGALY